MSGDVTVIFFGGPKNGDTETMPSMPVDGVKVAKPHNGQGFDGAIGNYEPATICGEYCTTKSGHIALYWCGWEDNQ